MSGQDICLKHTDSTSIQKCCIIQRLSCIQRIIFEDKFIPQPIYVYLETKIVTSTSRNRQQTAYIIPLNCHQSRQNTGICQWLRLIYTARVLFVSLLYFLYGDPRRIWLLCMFKTMQFISKPVLALHTCRQYTKKHQNIVTINSTVCRGRHIYIGCNSNFEVKWRYVYIMLHKCLSKVLTSKRCPNYMYITSQPTVAIEIHLSII